MRWSFRILCEEYLRGSYVCQVEPLSKPSLLRVPETPPGDNLPCVPHAGGVSFWRMTRRSPRSPGRVLRRGLGPFGRSTEPATEHLPPAKEGSIDADVLEPVQIAGERILSEHDHVRALAALQRAVSVLVPGQAVAALRRHPQCLLSGQVTISESPLTVVVPAGNRLPRRPQHRIGHSIG